jgi:hypothetical protein
MSAQARVSRSGGANGSVVAIRHAARSGASTATGRRSDWAAAATTAPAPASSQPVVRRSPRKAFQTSPAATRSSGSPTVPSASARATAYPKHEHARGRHPETQPCRGAAAVGGEEERPGRRGHGQQRQHRGEDPDVLGGAGEIPGRAPDAALEELDAARRLELGGEVGPELLERRPRDRADVEQRQRHGVPVAREHRPVRVAHPAAEQAGEGAAADDARDRRDDQRPARDQVRLGRQHELVGQALAHDRAHSRLPQRSRRAIREAVGVEHGKPRVAHHRRRHEQQRGQHDEPRGRPLTHASNVLPACQAERARSSKMRVTTIGSTGSVSAPATERPSGQPAARMRTPAAAAS